MTTATHESITRSDALSAEEAARHRLALKVHYATHDGDALIHSLMGFVNGDIPDARACHIHSATVELAVMGGYLPQDYPGAASRIHPANADADNPRPKPKVTLKQILNKPIGASIREDTEEGGLLIDFLAQMVNPPPNPDISSKEEVLPTDRLTAAKELLRRGYGSRNPYYYSSSSIREEKALNTKFADISRAAYDGIGLTTFLLDEVIRNPRRDRFGEPLKHTYTFSQRIWAAKYLLWRAFDIPWEHITPEAIDTYFRAKHANELADAQRRAQDAAQRKEAAKLTAEQKANVMAMFEQMQRQTDEADAKAAADAAKKAEKKLAKETNADHAGANNGNSAATPAKDTDAAKDKPAANDKTTGTDNANAKSAANSDNDNANNKNGENGNAAATGKDNANGKNTANNGSADANNNGDIAAGAHTRPGATATPPADRAVTNDKNGKNAAATSKDNASGNKSAVNNKNATGGKNADEDAAKSDNTDTDRNAPADTDTNTAAPDTPTTRGARAVANALARHPEVDLDTALENHHSTAGVPKQNLTHEQIYDAITAEANFQKRQAIIQRRLRAKNPDAPEDSDPPKTRSP